MTYWDDHAPDTEPVREWEREMYPHEQPYFDREGNEGTIDEVYA